MHPRRQHYQGRPLPRPDDEVVDQGLGFDLGTLLGRRSLLRALGVGTATVGMAACGVPGATTPESTGTGSAGSGASTTGATTEIPDETAGPYPGDGSNGADVLEQSGVVRSDLRSSFGAGTGMADGVPMELTLTIIDLAGGGEPFRGVAVYVWQCDREGRYSMYSKGVEDQNYLRGVQLADSDGRVTFQSIVPACYSGRWPHIHFEVYPDQAGIADAANAIATSQVALPEDVCRTVYQQEGYEQSVTNLSRISLQSDNVFGDDAAASQLATVTGDVASGYQAALRVGVDTTTPSGGGAPPGGSPRSR